MTDRDERALADTPLGYTSRRRFLQGAAGAIGVVGASLAAPGVFYRMADAIAAAPPRPAVGAKAPAQEQYLLRGTRVINVDGSGLQHKHGSVAVHVPALHDHVITAKLNVSTSPAALQEAQLLLESVLVDLESRFAPTPAGVGISIVLGTSLLRTVHPKPGQVIRLLRSRYPIPRLSADRCGDLQDEGREHLCAAGRQNIPQ